ncbi:hypothetical protein TNCV_259921 [Trichonephila clavipes]|uniref:Uncharacterized protein n=1 Tax=Trichonephila clavipes TaxID=2585209 RepID=A0A8X6RTG5_TRICX|nr:hypothetical protein TNCV_259921 [Trichonephila clavipes]
MMGKDLIKAHEIHLGKGLSDAHASVVIRSFEHHAGDRMIWVHPNFEGKHPGDGQLPPTSLHLPLAARRLFRVPPSCTFTSIHAFSGIQTQALRHSSQRH